MRVALGEQNVHLYPRVRRAVAAREQRLAQREESLLGREEALRARKTEAQLGREAARIWSLVNPSSARGLATRCS